MARRSTDTLVASGDFNFTHGAASLSISSGALVAFTAIEKARLTGGNSANTIDASLFAGSVILFGLNGANKLTGAVTDDLATDSMSGGAGQDWFFARVTAPADILSDKASNENLN